MTKCLFCNKELNENRLFCSDRCREDMGVRKPPDEYAFVIPFNELNWEEEEATTESGYIYVVQCNRFYKIGIAEDIKKRMAGLQTANPVKLRLLFCQKHSDYKNMERYFHCKFKHKRTRGEWFLLSNEDVEWLAVVFARYMLNNPRI